MIRLSPNEYLFDQAFRGKQGCDLYRGFSYTGQNVVTFRSFFLCHQTEMTLAKVAVKLQQRDYSKREIDYCLEKMLKYTKLKPAQSWALVEKTLQ